MGVIIKNYIKNLKNDKAHYIFIGFPLIISLCVGLTLRDKMFDVYADTRSRMFAIVCVAIWIGLFNSVLEICKERESIKMDLKSGFSAAELFMSRFLVQAVVCVFQSIIIFKICSLFVDFPKEGAVIENMAHLEYVISIFLITFSADVMGLLISSLCVNNDIANRSLPFILMVQFIFSGQLFELGDTLDKISKFTISKWGMNLLGSIGDITSLDLQMLVLKDSVLDAFECSKGHVVFMWLVLIAFIVVFSVLSVVFINRIKKDKK